MVEPAIPVARKMFLETERRAQAAVLRQRRSQKIFMSLSTLFVRP